MERGEENVSKLYETAEQARQNPTYLTALKHLLYQFADDDFIVSFRGSEWLGLAPHIEEDVAYSSITQNTMGHAAMFYDLLAALGDEEANVLAHDRSSEQRRNGIYLEKENGDGSYLEDPYFDWALAVVRGCFYEVFKRIKLKAVSNCSYTPLANVAQRVLMEQTYHLAHWKMWMSQLQHASEEARSRISTRIDEAWNIFGDVLELGAYGDEMVKYNLIESESKIQEQWMEEIRKIAVDIPERPLGKIYGSGRNGEHTADLDKAIVVFSEVYRTDKAATW